MCQCIMYICMISCVCVYIGGCLAQGDGVWGHVLSCHVVACTCIHASMCARVFSCPTACGLPCGDLEWEKPLRLTASHVLVFHGGGWGESPRSGSQPVPRIASGYRRSRHGRKGREDVGGLEPAAPRGPAAERLVPRLAVLARPGRELPVCGHCEQDYAAVGLCLIVMFKQSLSPILPVRLSASRALSQSGSQPGYSLVHFRWRERRWLRTSMSSCTRTTGGAERERAGRQLQHRPCEVDPGGPGQWPRAEAAHRVHGQLVIVRLTASTMRLTASTAQPATRPVHPVELVSSTAMPMRLTASPFARPGLPKLVLARRAQNVQVGGSQHSTAWQCQHSTAFEQPGHAVNSQHSTFGAPGAVHISIRYI